MDILIAGVVLVPRVGFNHNLKTYQVTMYTRFKYLIIQREIFAKKNLEKIHLLTLRLLMLSNAQPCVTMMIHVLLLQ
jgi:hypothetical protein